MATINYCDWDAGDDDTGDGTNLNPYKTITKASIDLTGGDEVRVAKSPDDTPLTGTVGFTFHSTAIIGVNTLFTTELTLGDFILAGDGQYYEITTITDDTNALIFKQYPSDTQVGIPMIMLGVTDTGAAISSGEYLQLVESVGTSLESRLRFSGGWDLTTELRSGKTYFRQMHSTFNNRWGVGIRFNNNSYIEVEHLNFLRHDRGIYFYFLQYSKVSYCSFIGAGDEGLYFYYMKHSEVNNLISHSNADEGIQFSNCEDCVIRDCVCNSNKYGFYVSDIRTNSDLIFINNTTNSNSSGVRLSSASGSGTVFESHISNYNSYGFSLYNSTGIINNSSLSNNYTGVNTDGCLSAEINNLVSENNNNDFSFRDSTNININTIFSSNTVNKTIYAYYSHNIVINNFTAINPPNNEMYVSSPGTYSPAISCQNYKEIGKHINFYEGYETSERDTENARTDECIKITKSNPYYKLSTDHLFNFRADSGVKQILSAYIKRDEEFNGKIEAAVLFFGVRITDWIEWIPEIEYTQHFITAEAIDIAQNGVLELVVRVIGGIYGGASVYLADLGVEYG